MNPTAKTLERMKNGDTVQVGVCQVECLPNRFFGIVRTDLKLATRAIYDELDTVTVVTAINAQAKGERLMTSCPGTFSGKHHYTGNAAETWCCVCGGDRQPRVTSDIAYRGYVIHPGRLGEFLIGVPSGDDVRFIRCERSLMFAKGFIDSHLGPIDNERIRP